METRNYDARGNQVRKEQTTPSDEKLDDGRISVGFRDTDGKKPLVSRTLMTEAEARTHLASVGALLDPATPPPTEPPPTEPPPTTPPPSGTIQLKTAMGKAGTTLQLGDDNAVYEDILFSGQVKVTGDSIFRRCWAKGIGGNAAVENPDVQFWASGCHVEAHQLAISHNPWEAGFYAAEDATFLLDGCDIHHNGARTDSALETRAHNLYIDKASGQVLRSRIAFARSFGFQVYPKAALTGRLTEIAYCLIEGGFGTDEIDGHEGVILGGAVHDVDVHHNWFKNLIGTVTSYQLTGARNKAHDNYATGCKSPGYSGTGYEKGSLALTPPPSDWPIPQPLVFAGP